MESKYLNFVFTIFSIYLIFVLTMLLFNKNFVIYNTVQPALPYLGKTLTVCNEAQSAGLTAPELP